MITHERLLYLLSYDPETGVFRWNVNHHKMHAGDIAGGIGAKGYWMIGIDCVRYYAHRLAWFYMTGEWPSEKIDHKDTNRIRNVWENLRPATTSQNAVNSGLGKTNTSGFKGVSWNAKLSRWQTHIRINGRSTYLGLFDDPRAEHAAYCRAAEAAHGEFARTS